VTPAEVLSYLVARTSVDPTTGCWIWQLGLRQGYAAMNRREGGRSVNHRVHRWAYHHLIAPVSDGEVMHHTCGRRACVYMGHLQVTGCHANTAEMLERQSYLARISALERLVAVLLLSHLTQGARSLDHA
jgi:hypothetical protein